VLNLLMTPPPCTATLAEWVRDARRKSIALIDDLGDDQLLGPRLAVVNPVLWEIGHIAWFQEKWILRHASGRPPIRDDADALYDSAAVPHDVRWDLPLLRRDVVFAYADEVELRVLERLHDGPADEALAYFTQLAVFHEDMHTEAFTYTRQTHGYAPPLRAWPAPRTQDTCGPLPGDVEIPGGVFEPGARPGPGFVFDNEKWAHPVTVEPFGLARAPVTQLEFLAFVEDDGYQRCDLWCEAGWQWRERVGATHPVYWERR
jgi:iron(II)-dependent oxidoreductase